ncbi:MAG: molybdate ABC transporter substrate-binding protein [Desulfovibrionaceae bacterium]
MRQGSWMRRVMGTVLVFFGMLAPAHAAEITVSAAASLREAFTAVQQEFQKTHPDIRVHTNFAASNPLLKQLQEGAPVDVFASADQETMDKAAKSKVIIPSSRKNFVVNSLVLIVPAKSTVRGLEDLRTDAVKRIAIGSPESVPAGRYARQSLQSTKMWDALQAKFVMGESVRQVLDYVARGEVDAGFVYMTDALQSAPKTEVRATMSGHSPVIYPIAIAAKSANVPAAKAFVAFVCSDAGQAILAKYGFKKP